MNEEKKNRDALFITIIAILTLTLIGIGYDWYVKGSNLETCNQSNELMSAELEELNQIMIGGDIELMADNIKDNLRGMLSQYETMATDNAELNDSISKEKEKIQQLLTELENEKKYSARKLYKLNKENETLRRIMQGYVRTIDSLNTQNIALKNDLTVQGQQLTQVTSERDQALSENEELSSKVNIGSKLQATSIVGTAFKLKASGKQVETVRASRANMLKACFTLNENKIAKAGNKRIYLRVIAPDSKVLINKSSTTLKDATGKDVQSSSHRDINYQNAATDMCIFFENENEFIQGEYILELYSEQAKIGVTSFALK